MTDSTDNDDPQDLHDLAHHDSPRPPLADRAHDMLQRQIDALLTHARTVTHQIADLTIRAQRMDAELATSSKAILGLTRRVEDHLVISDRREMELDHRMADLSRTQGEILTAVQAGAEVMQQVRDARTAGRVLTGLLKGTGGVVIAIGVIGGALFAAVRFMASTPI